MHPRAWNCDWYGRSGQRWLITGELLLFSGHEQENAPRTQGVALMLSRTAQRALIGWEEHSLLVITATFTKERRINREEFYSRLLTIIQYCPELNIIMINALFKLKNRSAILTQKSAGIHVNRWSVLKTYIKNTIHRWFKLRLHTIYKKKTYTLHYVLPAL